jgi:acyl-CoA synthetase (AMP-forming)/AMP-acid ligase II
MIFKSLTDTTIRDPERVAVIHGQREVTYTVLETGMSRLAAFLLEFGIQKGSRTVIINENSPEYIISYLGVQKAGGISVAVNPQYSAYELKKIFSNCTPCTLIVERKYLKSALEAAREAASIETIIVSNVQGSDELSRIQKKIVDFPTSVKLYALNSILGNNCGNVSYPVMDDNDIASIIYTSGTTGEPKGVMLSHANFSANARSIIEYLCLTESDRTMVILPFYYSYGTSLLTTAVVSGSSLVLENSFMYPGKVLDKMVETGVTGFAGVPSTFAILLNRSNIRNYTFPELRYLAQAGGAMTPNHAQELAEVVPGTDIFIMYGQTEAAPRLTYLPPEDLFRKPGSIGKAIPGVTIELVREDGTPAGVGEEGEIVAQGDNVMVGYWKNPGETNRILKQGRLHTGDLAVMDEEGYLKIISRRSDMIKSGAHRISPKEIEEVILELTEIHETAVVGEDDEILGVVIKAVIVLKDGIELDAKRVQKHCHQKLAPFKVPKVVVFAEELPKTSSGKVRKHLLVDSGASVGSSAT